MDKADTTPDPDSELREAFQRHLPERISAIEEHWQGLLREDWDPSRARWLFQRVQDLVGTSGRFGLLEVSEALFRLELVLRPLADGLQPPTETQIGEAGGRLEEIRMALERGRRSPDELPHPETPAQRIYYLRFDDSLAPGLSGALEAQDYRVSRFNRLDDLMAAVTQAPPVALVIDAQMLPSLKPLTDYLARLRGHPDGAPPLLLLSPVNDLDTRLQAMRAGADAFVTTPIDGDAVAARIRRLTRADKGQGFRILVVDDDPSQANFAASLLRKAGMETCAITDPRHVLDALDAFRPDLVLMDLYMPGADGMELTSIIREQQEFVGIPIVFLSGEQNTDKQLDALSAGGDDFIAKPIHPRHLISVIQNRVQRARALREGSAGANQRDSLTGLFSRRYFFERLDKAVTAGGSQPAARGVLYLELDQQEALHKQLGGARRDALLTQVGAQLAARVEPQDVIARMGEGSFAVLALRPLPRDLLRLGEGLLRGLAQGDFGQLPAPPTLSLGLCPFEAAPEDASGLLRRAMQACAQAQAQGGNRLQLYQAEAATTGPGAAGGPDATTLVREALRSQSFQLLYQPFIGLRDPKNENYEIMPRLRVGPGEPLGPAEILPAARQLGLLLDLDRWLILRALEILDERRQLSGQMQLLVSQSAESLADDRYPAWLREQLRDRLLVGTGLILEFNLVDMATDPKRGRALIGALRDMGVMVCLARFGHNEASYKVLGYLGARFVKVVDKLLTADPPIIDALLARVHELGAQVIVPRMDDPGQITRQWLAGADFAQGNAIQRPREQPDYDFSRRSP